MKALDGLWKIRVGDETLARLEALAQAPGGTALVTVSGPWVVAVQAGDVVMLKSPDGLSFLTAFAVADMCGVRHDTLLLLSPCNTRCGCVQTAATLMSALGEAPKAIGMSVTHVRLMLPYHPITRVCLGASEPRLERPSLPEVLRFGGIPLLA